VEEVVVEVVRRGAGKGVRGNYVSYETLVPFVAQGTGEARLLVGGEVQPKCINFK